MNSKEALESCFNVISTNDKIRWEEHYKVIKKDLEVLDIIKKWSFIQENYKDGYGKFTQFLCNIHTIGMKEDFEKIKEWLENEKANTYLLHQQD